MKTLAFLFAIALVTSPARCEDLKPTSTLSTHVAGLMNSYDIVTKSQHPVAYLQSLKVPDTTVILSGDQRYQLARNLLDCHHLCQALSHQGYSLDTDVAILKLAATNFTGFSKCIGEGGYSTWLIADFFESGQIEWGVDSSFENQSQKK